MFSAMGVWTSLEPQLTTPHPSPSPQEGGESTEFAALYRNEFWKMDLEAFTGRGQGGPCLTDAAHRPLPMLPSQTCRYAATRTMPQRSSRLE
jgi:hypothetical protein